MLCCVVFFLVLFCFVFVLFFWVLFCFVLFCFVLFLLCFVLLCFFVLFLLFVGRVLKAFPPRLREYHIHLAISFIPGFDRHCFTACAAHGEKKS